MDIKEIKSAIKHQQNKNSYPRIDMHLKNDCKSDDQAVSYGPITTEIASSLGITLSKARYYLNKYHKIGLLVKLDANGGCCRWWYCGLLDEIKGEL